MKKLKTPAMLLLVAMATTACQQNDKQTAGQETTDSTAASKYLSKPVIEDIYTADPSAHVFDGKIYIYPSHDIDAGTPENDMGDHFDMNDYHVLSMDSVNGKATDHGVALSVKDVPWAGRQMWAPDAAYKNGTYYLYFPAKDKNDVFRIGVATAKTPTGPFKAEPKPIEGSYSMDPAVFTDTDGNSYMYFGGIWGGQLQRWKDGKYDPNGSKTDSQKEDEPALAPRVAKMSKDMLSFDGPVKEVKILTKDGKEILTKDHDRRFFEASWVHKFNNKYYFTYSTGDTHYLAYAIGDNPMGPFVYQDKFMNPVQGWTTHHSIAEVKGRWYVFYHDTQLSNKTHLRNVKVAPLEHLADGSIKLIEPLKK
jgi:hypothetical protein